MADLPGAPAVVVDALQANTSETSAEEDAPGVLLPRPWVRSGLDNRFQEPGQKGPLWEEVTVRMAAAGYGGRSLSGRKAPAPPSDSMAGRGPGGRPLPPLRWRAASAASRRGPRWPLCSPTRSSPVSSHSASPSASPLCLPHSVLFYVF